MGFFSKLFTRSPADLMAKGDRLMDAGSYFDARGCYEDGLNLCSGSAGETGFDFSAKIDHANYKLAELNIEEAEHSLFRGDTVKAIDHLDLVKTLTYDEFLREKADALLRSLSSEDDIRGVPPVASSCSSCSSSGHGGGADTPPVDDLLPLSEYYELLIQQLPIELYHRYAVLGEDFAYAFIAASRDEHQEALSLLDVCEKTLPRDIYCYEKGKLLHRIGEEAASERYLRESVAVNSANALAWFNLALMLRESGRLEDALSVTDTMLGEQILPEQAVLLRADIYEETGEHQKAIDGYVELLSTQVVKVAAERLYVVLTEVGRHADASVILKKYLGKSCH